ncbi:MAG: SDR family oxidoreductase [Hyphomicrobiaceae bacterium]|nr:SDR family oxidoreductase [Hyphomicrobiaceae bacterium]
MPRKLAVVTGGASGIGEATARRFSQDGYAVAVVDLNEINGAAVASSLPDARFYACDVSDLDAVAAVARRVEAEMGVADALVCSAGIIPNTESVMDMDLAAHKRMWDVNYNGTLYTVRTFAHAMAAAGRGAIVTLGSINSRAPLPIPAYNMGKAVIERLTQLLAVELGRNGVRVNSVGPTYVMTPPLRAKVQAGQRDLAKIMSVHALDRLPEPSDIANAIAFLCSDQAAAITGVLLPVDAGFLSAVSYRTYAGGVPWEQ